MHRRPNAAIQHKPASAIQATEYSPTHTAPARSSAAKAIRPAPHMPVSPMSAPAPTTPYDNQDVLRRVKTRMAGHLTS